MHSPSFDILEAADAVKNAAFARTRIKTLVADLEADVATGALIGATAARLSKRIR